MNSLLSSPVLERGYWARDAAVAAHVEACAACAVAWRRIAELVRPRAPPPPAASTRSEELRTTLLAGAMPRRRACAGRGWLFVPLAAAAAALAVWMWAAAR